MSQVRRFRVGALSVIIKYYDGADYKAVELLGTMGARELHAIINVGIGDDGPPRLGGLSMIELDFSPTETSDFAEFLQIVAVEFAVQRGIWAEAHKVSFSD